MDFQINGKIVAVLPIQRGVSRNGNPYATQDYVVETQDQYKQKVCFNVFGEDKINQFQINVGDDVIVNFNITANLYNAKWYNRIQAWKVIHIAPTSQQANNRQQDEKKEEEAPF